MADLSRRALIAACGGAMAWAGAAAVPSLARPSPSPRRSPDPAARTVGVQLWMVRESLARDYAGTLAALARLGVQQVELATIPSLAPAAFRRQLNDLGLSCTSAHMPLLAMNDDEVANALQLAAALGLRHIFAPTPGFDGIGALPLQDRMTALIRRGLTADDWRWNAQRLNQLGERAIAAGLRLGYHNHNIEFGALPDAGRPIDLLLQGTEAALVDFQIDVGNAVLGGGDPMALVAAHPTRFAAAHLKDWAPPLTVTTRASLPPASAPFGAGVIDWARWASVSAAAGITAQFIEQEGLAAQAGLEGAAQGVRFFARGS